MNLLAFSDVSKLAIGAIAVSLLAVVAGGERASAQSITLSPGTTYTQDFNTLATNGSKVPITPTSLPNGWYISDPDGYTPSTGSTSSAGIYSYGNTNTDTERALGSYTTAGTGNAPFRFGAQFQISSTQNITSFVISYTGEQWLQDDSTTDKLAFEYSTNATSLSSGTWTSFAALDFASPSTASTIKGELNGNLAANQTAFNEILTPESPLANGSVFWIRWTDSLSSNNKDDGLAVDNVSITAQAEPVPEPITILGGLTALGMGGAIKRKMRGEKKVEA